MKFEDLPLPIARVDMPQSGAYRVHAFFHRSIARYVHTYVHDVYPLHIQSKRERGIYTYIYIHIYIHTYMYIYIHIYIYIHTLPPNLPINSSILGGGGRVPHIYP